MSKLHWRIIGGVVLLALAVALPQVLRSSYEVHLAILVIINAVLAMIFVQMLRAGLLNLSIGAFWGIGAYASAMLTLKGGLSFWAALPLAVAFSAMIALVIGAVLVRNGGFGFVMPSLIFAFIVPLIIGTFQIFGGYVGLIGVPKPNPIPLPGGSHIVFGSEKSFYYLLLVFAVVIIGILLALYRGWTGRVWRAVGLSTNLAESVGIDLFRYRLLCYVITSALAGLLGVFFGAYSANILPDTFGPMQVLYIQMYAIVGGVASPILGPIIGAGILTSVPELLRSVGNFEPIVTGAIIILILIFLPQGILGLAAGRRRSEAWELLAKLFTGGQSLVSAGFSRGPKAVPPETVSSEQGVEGDRK